MIEIRYRVPAGADWVLWDDVNAVLSFMTDAEAVENALENERELGDEFGVAPLPDDPVRCLAIHSPGAYPVMGKFSLPASAFD